MASPRRSAAFFRGTQGSVGAMVFYNTLPLYGALLGHLFLGESSGMAYLVGGALIIGGGLWAARGRSLDR